MKQCDSSSEALEEFCESLRERGMVVSERKKVKAMFAEDQVLTTTKEIFHLKIRLKGRWIPKASSQVSALGKPLDDRLKHAIRSFGKEDDSISGINENVMLDLLDMESAGYRAYLVTLFPKTGEAYWCYARDAYAFIMAHGLLPQISFQGEEGKTLCQIPTGWMKLWEKPVHAPPQIING